MPFGIVRASRCCVFAHRSIGLTSMFETTSRSGALSGAMVRQDRRAVGNWGKAQVLPGLLPPTEWHLP
jgi:hypothetical protein